MAEDRGGIDYSILVKDEFSSNLARFKSDIAAAKAEWIAFRKELQGRAKGASAGRGQAREARQASSQAKKQLREETQQFNARAAAIQKVNRENQRIQVNREAAIVTSRRQFNNERLTLTALERRQAAEKRLTRELNRERKAEDNLAAVRARGQAISERTALNLGLASKVRLGAAKKLTELETQQLALQKATARANDKELGQITAQTAALKIKAAAQQRAAVAGILRAEGLDPRGNALALERSPQQFNALRKSIDTTNNSANRISFTFRRLFGILAAFTAARLAVAGFGRLVTDSIRLNAELEQSVLGVGALITALGDVVSPSGLVADNAERLAAAQGEARRQLELLRVDALKTAATYSELADTFQVALAPGFQAGLDLDEIRRLTIRISQAAGAIGLPQNQLPEEIRSLLTGTITPRNTKIATSLGITNEDIRKAKEAGELVDFLEDRFAAFAQAGEEALGTFDAITTNLIDGLNQILRIGGLDFFNTLKASLNEILSLVASTNDDNMLVFNEDAIAVVKEITDGLKAAVEEAAGIGEALNLEDARRIAGLLGKTIAGIAKTSAPLLEGVLSVLSLTGRIVEFVTSLGIVNELVLTILGRTLAIAALLRTGAALLGGLAIIKTTLVSLLLPLRAISIAVKGIQTQTLTLRRSLVLIRASLFAIAPALALASIAFTGLRIEAKQTQFASDALVEKFRQMPSVIAQSTDSLEKQKELAQELRDEFEKATDAFEVSVGTAGLSGAIQEQTRGVIELAQRTRDLQRKAAAEERTLEKRREELRNKELKAQEKRAELFGKEDDGAKGLQNTILKIQELQKEQEENRKRILRFQEKESDVARQGIESLKEQNKQLKEKEDLQVQELARVRAIALAVSRRDTASSTSKTVDDLRQLVNLATGPLGILGLPVSLGSAFDATEEDISNASEQIDILLETEKEVLSLQAKIEAANIAIAASKKSTNRLASEENQLAAIRNRIEAERFIGPFVTRTSQEPIALNSIDGVSLPSVTPDIDTFVNQENELLRLQLANRQRLAEAERSLGNVRRTEALNELAIAEQSFAFQNRQAALDLQALESLRKENADNQFRARGRLEELKDLEQTAEVEDERRVINNEQILLRAEAVALEKQHEALATRIALKYKEQKLTVEELTEKAELQNNTLANVFAGFKKGLKEVNNEVRNTADIAKEVTISAAEGASKLISDLIVDAFDPTKDSSIEERIGSFFQGIARQLLQLTTMAIIFRSLFDSTGVATGFGSFIGLAKGGLVPEARGYAAGGTIRPAGLPPSDTVPIWATPGEFMVKKRAVSTYGADTIAAINNMLVDPGSLRSLAGLTGRRRASRRRSGAGFAMGGTIPSDTGAGGSSGTGTQMPIVVPLPADNATMEALLNGGQGAMFAFAQSNRRRFRSALGID